MEEKFDDIILFLKNVYEVFQLEIKENRGTSTIHKGEEPPVSKTETCFTWKLKGMMSKLNPNDYTKEDKSWVNDQKIQYLEIKSDHYDFGFWGYKTREKAIEEALEFAKQHGIEVDGYTINEHITKA